MGLDKQYFDKQGSSLETKLAEDQAQVNDKGLFQKITEWYFEPKSFEKSGKLYEYLGIKYFKKLVMGTTGKLRKMLGDGKEPSNYFIGEKRNSESLKQFEKGSRLNERIHGPLTLFFLPLLAYSLGEDHYGTAIFNGLNILLNGYLTMLQRYNRARVYNVLERRNKKKLDKK
ncbi:hypothetical protein HY643_04300 [Candidatus Woesearchaeota archaeon]|nr:hypothetical protein [Candidatus Woesearchaeota archaeon]